MQKKIHVAIGSQNPCKIDSVKSAFHKVFQNLNNNNNDNDKIVYELVFSSHNVPSKVNDQPVGDDETLLGARNRAMGALESAMKLHSSSNTNDDSIDQYGPPHFGVGLEGGIEIKESSHNYGDSTSKNKQLWCMAWMAIVGSNSTICTSCKDESSTFNDTNEKIQWSTSKTASFLLPNKISDLILNHNYELGHADDVIFNRVNSKQKSGTVGVLTKGLITRSDYYDHALILALVGFIWPEHYVS